MAGRNTWTRACLMAAVACLLVVTLVACGGSGARDQAAVTVTLSQIDTAMTAAQTVRYEGTGGTPVSQVSGDIDWARRFVTMRSTGALGLDLAFLQQDHRFYLRGPTNVWCRTPARNPSQAVSPFGTLDALLKSGARPDYIGRDEIRGVKTSHYRLNGKVTQDLWIDADDRLRQVSGAVEVPAKLGGGTYPFSYQLFDFGTRVEFFPPPNNTPSCERA